jgi:hypothetical protein
MLASAMADLIELRSIVIEACDEERDAEWSHTTALRELLHDGGELTGQQCDGDRIVILEPVFLAGLSALVHQHAEVGTHTRVGDADVGSAVQSRNKAETSVR